MSPLHRIFALLTLLGWLFAAGHVASEHGGVADGGVKHALLGCVNGGDHDDHHDDGPAQDCEHHQHHDLTALGVGQRVKDEVPQGLAPSWMLFSDEWSGLLADMLGERCGSCLPWARDGSLEDRRASGWLLVCQTARCVRGPSLVA